jgi:hypothetical protein
MSSPPALHWVGGALTDSGDLPLAQWPHSSGDLRVAHVFSIHTMHFSDRNSIACDQYVTDLEQSKATDLCRLNGFSCSN